MNLFLSYGHPESEICKKVKDALTAHGHKVWIDEAEIKAGNDWRVKIQQGIQESNGVIACLSKHSVRDPGVCLNELSIAVGVRGGNIKTILLDSEKEVQPPPTVSHLQWLDMHDWRERQAADPEAFETWFREKMEILFSVVESEDSQAFVGQITAIRKALPLSTQYNASRQYYLLSQKYVGRQWLTQEVEDWLHDPNGERLAVLYGDAGVGKSAFAAQYLHHSPSAAAGFFCEYDKPHFSDPRSVVQTLAYLLACRLPAYRMQLAVLLEEQGSTILQLNASEQFNQLLTIPLSRTIDHETLCIVIDALDECRQDENTTLLSILRDWMPLLPPWLRVLTTARDVEAVKAPLSGAHRIYLHGGDKSNLRDVRCYYEEQLKDAFGSRPNWEASLDALTERSGGVFLYATLTAQGILNGQLNFDDPGSFPTGLSDAFHRWFGWICPSASDYKEHLQLPLGAMLAAGQPLPVEELERILGWDENDTADFLSQAEVILRYGTSPFGAETIELSHKYLADWLSDRKKSGIYFTSPKAAAERMARRYSSLLEKHGADSLTAFEALQLVPLLEQCNLELKPELEELYQKAVQDSDLVWKLFDCGDYCKEWGKLGEALQYYRAAEHNGAIAFSRKPTQEAQRNLSISYSSIADVLKLQGQLAQALELYEKAKAIAEALAEHDSAPEAQRDLSISCEKAAGILEIQGQLTKALELYEQARAIDEALAQHNPTPQAQRDLSLSYGRIADILKEQGQLTQALQLHRQANAILEELAQCSPTPQAQWDLSLNYCSIAEVLEAQGEPEQALALYEKACAIAKALAERNPTPNAQRNLFVNCSRIGYIRKELGQPDQALELYRQAKAIAEALVQCNPTPEALQDLSTSYIRIADVLNAQEQPEEALGLFRQAKAILEELAAQNSAADTQLNLSLCYNKIAEILAAQEQPAEALELYQQANRILENLAASNPTPGALRNLSLSYYCIAEILEAQGQLTQAFELYEKAMAIDENLAAQNPTKQAKQVLLGSCFNLACLYEEQEQLSEALGLYEKAKSIAEELFAQEPTPENKQDLDSISECIAMLSES